MGYWSTVLKGQYCLFMIVDICNGIIFGMDQAEMIISRTEIFFTEGEKFELVSSIYFLIVISLHSLWLY